MLLQRVTLRAGTSSHRQSPRSPLAAQPQLLPSVSGVPVAGTCPGTSLLTLPRAPRPKGPCCPSVQGPFVQEGAAGRPALAPPAWGRPSTLCAHLPQGPASHAASHSQTGRPGLLTRASRSRSPGGGSDRPPFLPLGPSTPLPPCPPEPACSCQYPLPTGTWAEAGGSYRETQRAATVWGAGGYLAGRRVGTGGTGRTGWGNPTASRGRPVRGRLWASGGNSPPSS